MSDISGYVAVFVAMFVLCFGVGGVIWCINVFVTIPHCETLCESFNYTRAEGAKGCTCLKPDGEPVYMG